MAMRLDSFGLTELAAKPEDAFRLAGLAMAEGRRIPGYGGDYYYYRMGDAAAVIRKPARRSCWAWTPTPVRTASGPARW